MLTRATTYWTAAMTMPNEEYRVAHHVEKFGFDYYLPITHFPDKAGKLRIKRVLFPRYIFILLKAGWECLLQMPRIFRIFMLDEKPVPVPMRDIKVLMAMEDKDGIIKLPTSIPPDPRALRPGVMAKIRSDNVRDAFAGQTCRVLVLHESGRCEVALKIMGKDVRTVLPQAALSVVLPKTE
jgi:transcription antitermination factor NusG